MKKLSMTLLIIICSVAISHGMGSWNPKPEEPKPEKPPEVIKKELKDYIWEDSDSVVGKSYVMLPSGVLASLVRVNSTHFEYVQTWHNGRELWYGPMLKEFPKSSEITVTGRDGIIYSSEVVVPEPQPPSGQSELLTYWGKFNPNRPTWYAEKRLENYPRTVTVRIEGCETRTITHNGIRYDQDGLILKQSDVPGRGAAIVYKASCQRKIAHLEYQ